MACTASMDYPSPSRKRGSGACPPAFARGKLWHDQGAVVEAPGLWIPAFEAVRKSTIGWIGTVRPSRQLLRSFLRMRNFLNAIKDFPHVEERTKSLPQART